MPLLKHNNNSISNVTSFALVPSGSPVLLATSTASGSASISFTTGIDSTYDIYKFEFINIHPATQGVGFSFQANTGYNQTITSTVFRAYHNEAGTDTALTYDTSNDQAQGTGFQRLMAYVDNQNDDAGNGELFIFNPSSTTYVKHFISKSSYSYSRPYEGNDFVAGYFNTTSAINAVQFKMSSGNIDAGTIKMYGIK
jgi:hypothetical protein